MREMELALAVSAREWSENLHRFLVDHGGARVRLQVLSSDEALAETYDVLLIDDICSFLTPRLVEQVRRSGRHVVGVYDPDEFADGKDRLLECGVDDVVEAGAHPDEFVRIVERIAANTRRHLSAEEPATAVSEKAAQVITTRHPLTVVGGPAGAGATEVAIAIALRLGSRHRQVVLVDGDEVAPSLAQRLGLPLHPNLRAAIDMVQHRSGGLDASLHHKDRLLVLPGLSSPRDWLEVRPTDVLHLVEELRAGDGQVLVNVGSQLEATGFGESGRYGISRALVSVAERLVAVGSPDPVGVTRLLGWAAEAAELAGAVPIHLLINRSPSSLYRKGEVREELERTVRPSSIDFFPYDSGVAAAAWTGATPPRGRFLRAVDRFLARELLP